MNQFTVVLLYPDYYTDNYGETWCDTVSAPDPVAAVGVAQKTCAAETDLIINPEDLLPVSVFEGDHPNLVGQWAAAQTTPPPMQVRTA